MQRGGPPVVSNTKILISGAGISGLTLAYWLQKQGFSPTIIEKRPDLHDRGFMIDFYGAGFDIVEKMGLVKQLREKASQYPVKKLTFVDHEARPRATLDVEKFRQLLDYRYTPILRGDLEAVMYAAVQDTVRI